MEASHSRAGGGVSFGPFGWRRRWPMGPEDARRAPGADGRTSGMRAASGGCTVAVGCRACPPTEGKQACAQGARRRVHNMRVPYQIWTTLLHPVPLPALRGAPRRVFSVQCSESEPRKVARAGRLIYESSCRGPGRPRGVAARRRVCTKNFAPLSPRGADLSSCRLWHRERIKTGERGAQNTRVPSCMCVHFWALEGE